MAGIFRRRNTPSGGTPAVPGYTGLTLIGRGAFSHVYRARQDRFDRWVALKVLSVTIDDETARRRFQRECRVMGRLSGHPHIVTVYDADVTDEGAPYIAMEHLDGGSLAGRQLDVTSVLATGVAIASALHAAHDQGILHRDVKPQNVLLSRYDQPALSDFGLSVLSRQDASLSTIGYTPAFAPPELLENKAPDARSDVYSLGATLYALLAGHPPFADEPDQAIPRLLMRILTEPIPEIAGAQIPPEVMDLLRRSMARDPADRPATALDLARLLQGLQERLGLPRSAVAVAPIRDDDATTEPGRAPDDHGTVERERRGRDEAEADAVTDDRRPTTPDDARPGDRDDPDHRDEHRTVARSRERREPVAERTDGRRRPWIAVLAATAVTVVLAIVAVLALGGGEAPEATDTTDGEETADGDPDTDTDGDPDTDTDGGGGDEAPEPANRPEDVSVEEVEGSDGAIVRVRWSGQDGALYWVIWFAEGGPPGGLEEPVAGTSTVVEVDPDAGYCFVVADHEDLASASTADSPETAFSAPVCVRGASPETVGVFGPG